VATVLEMNPSMYTLQGSNTFVVGTGKARILIDTGEGRPGYVPNLLACMHRIGCKRISDIVCTHHHFDHVGGVDALLAHFAAAPPRVWTATGTEPLDARGTPRTPHFAYHKLTDAHVFRTEGATLDVLATPGHCDDHVCLWLREERAVFAGDCVLGHGTSKFDDLHAYMRSLRRIAAMKPATIYPGHGAVVGEGGGGGTAAMNHVNGYIAHRQKRETQLLTHLAAASDGGGLSSADLTRRIYAKLPEEYFAPAHGNVLLVLHKLQKDKVVVSTGAAATEQTSATTTCACSATTTTTTTAATSAAPPPSTVKWRLLSKASK
jgi:glyoxylase-like metal-dependent hydrolase (beta-lactamase superfamily II)